MADDMNTFGTFLFSLQLTQAQGIGPLFNETSCAGCHNGPTAGGMGVRAGQDVRLIGRFRADGTFDNMEGHGGPTARTRSVTELGVPCGKLQAGVPAGATVVAQRNAMALRGDGLIDTVVLGDLMVIAAAQPEAVRGRPNILPDGRVGKFGWKAHGPTLVEFMGSAFRNEMGVTNPLQPRDEASGCQANGRTPDVDAFPLQAATKFLNTIDPPAPTAACLASNGAALFQSTGCATCHTPTLPGPGARQAVAVYSDLLLHDMGSALDDRMQMGAAGGNEWRTAPLWQFSERTRFLHDGRAATAAEAIALHGGQGRTAAEAFAALDTAAKQALISFLGCL
jgi:CxxC motif-containing protein (DUF1111 family)